VTSYRDDASGSLPEGNRRRLPELAERLRLAGAADPESWALSEVSEDIAQLTRFLFLRRVWRRMRSCADDALAGKLRRDGASEDHLRACSRRVRIAQRLIPRPPALWLRQDQYTRSSVAQGLARQGGKPVGQVPGM